MTVHLNRGGQPWTPNYILEINSEDCIGCGRCYKVCGHGVLMLMGVNEDDEFVALNDDDDDDEIERKVMTIANGGNCIGCGSCGRVCGKNCQTHGVAA
jgi:Nif-specific ferredoxin III